MFLVLLALLSVIIALIRKGSVANIIGNGTKAWYLFIISILGFVALKVGDAMGIEIIQQYSMVITLASYSILLLGAILNLVNLWMFPVLIGALMNFVVIFINGGKMPVSLQAMEIAHIAKEVIEASSSMSVATTSTTLPYLCGIIPIPLPWIFAEVISPGTLIIGVGLFAIIQNILMGVVYEYDYEDDDDEYYDDDYEEDEEVVEEKKKPARKKKPEPEEATDALTGKDYTEETPGEQEDIKNIVDEGLSDELGDLLKPDDLFDLDSFGDTIPGNDEEIQALEVDGTEEEIVMPENDDNVLDVSDFGSDEIPEIPEEDQSLVEMDDFPEITDIPEGTKLEDFPEISEVAEENGPEQTEESLTGEDAVIPEEEGTDETAVPDLGSEEFLPELPEASDEASNDVSEEDFTLDDGTQLRLDDFETEDIEDLIPVYDDEPGGEDNVELSPEDDYQEEAPADDTGIPSLPDFEEEDAVAEQFDDAFENRDFDEDIIFDTGSFDVGTSLPSEIKEEIPKESEAVEETSPVEEPEPAVKPEIESADSAETETAPEAEPIQQTVSVPVDEPEVKPEIPVFRVPDITPKPEVEKTEENISEYFARLAFEDFPEDGTSQPAVPSDTHISIPVSPAAPEPVRVTEPVNPAVQERPIFDQREYRVIHDENSESQVVEKTLEKMDYIMDKGPLKAAASTESVTEQTASVGQGPVQPAETPIDTDSPYIIKDGKIIENPYYKFKKTSPVKPLDFVERFTRGRSEAGGYQPSESRKTESEPEVPRRSRYDEITFDRIYSTDSSSDEKEPVGNVEMKIGDVQITFYKKDEK